MTSDGLRFTKHAHLDWVLHHQRPISRPISLNLASRCIFDMSERIGSLEYHFRLELSASFTAQFPASWAPQISVRPMGVAPSVSGFGLAEPLASINAVDAEHFGRHRQVWPGLCCLTWSKLHHPNGHSQKQQRPTLRSWSHANLLPLLLPQAVAAWYQHVH